MSNQTIKDLVLKIDYLHGGKIDKIEKGWSKNKKYLIRTMNSKYIVTLFEHAHYDLKCKQFEILKYMQELDVRVPKPIEMNQIDNMGYMILPYIEGTDGEELLTQIDEHAQYQLGIEAGKELRKMHQLKPRNERNNWYEHKKAKHLRYVSAYHALDHKIKQGEKILSFIDKHIYYLKEQPTRFQHDDFHVGNLIMKNDQIMGVIDFDLMDWGDPIHDFVKVGTVSRMTSIPFCIGQIHGYHEQEPDEQFWYLYAIYHAMAAVSTIVWAHKFHPSRIDEAMHGINQMLDDHQYFNKIKPEWYQEIKNIAY